MARLASKRLVPVCVTSPWLSFSLDHKDWGQHGRDTRPAATGRSFTRCEVPPERVSSKGTWGWGFWFFNPFARKAGCDTTNDNKAQERARKETERPSLHGLMTKTDEYEIEIARVNVDNAVLRKDNVRLKQENQRLQSLKRLGESRLQRAVRGGNLRSSKIAWSLITVCPFLNKEDAAVFALNIDRFENFDHPDKLRAEVVSTTLFIYWGSEGESQWCTQYPIEDLTQTQQETLLAEVCQQITEQKALHPVRAQIKQACEKHLKGILCIGGESTTPAGLHSYMCKAKNKKAVATKMHKELCHRFENVFHELDNTHIDVEATLLDSWKPLELLQATWLHAFLQGCTGPEPLRIELKIPAEEMTEGALSLYDAWRNLQVSASSSLLIS